MVRMQGGSTSTDSDAHPLVAAARIAVLGALAATAGDLGQLWVVNSGRAALHLAPPPQWLIVIATLAGAIGIPLYALGYQARARQARFLAPQRAAAVAAFGAAFGALGGSVHAVTGVLIWSRVGGIASELDPLQGILASGPIVLTLWALAGAAFLAAAACEAALPQPLRQRLANPLLLTLLLTGAAMLLPVPWRDLLAPASINIAHLVFFAGWVVPSRVAMPAAPS